MKNNRYFIILILIGVAAFLQFQSVLHGGKPPLPQRPQRLLNMNNNLFIDPKDIFSPTVTPEECYEKLEQSLKGSTYLLTRYIYASLFMNYLSLIGKPNTLTINFKKEPTKNFATYWKELVEQLKIEKIDYWALTNKVNSLLDEIRKLTEDPNSPLSNLEETKKDVFATSFMSAWTNYLFKNLSSKTVKNNSILTFGETIKEPDAYKILEEGEQIAPLNEDNLKYLSEALSALEDQNKNLLPQP